MKTHLFPFLIFLLLAGGYWVKESRGVTPLRAGFSNEPLLAMNGEPGGEFMEHDDCLRYSPIPYTPSHVFLLRKVWGNGEEGIHGRYRTWMVLLVLASALSVYTWIYQVCRDRVVATGLAVAAQVGYFENSWAFILWGVRDINISARADYAVLTPIFLLLFLHLHRRLAGSTFFFFLLGLSVNIHPGMAVAAFPFFALAWLGLRRREWRKTWALVVFAGVFLLGALPLGLQYRELSQRYEESHSGDPEYHSLVRTMESVLEPGTPETKGERGMSGFLRRGTQPVIEILRWFILFPPFVLLAGAAFLARVSKFRATINPGFEKAFPTLVISGTLVILLGWALEASAIVLPGPLATGFRPLYLGTWIMVLLLGGASGFFSKILRWDFPAKDGTDRLLLAGTLVWTAVFLAQSGMALRAGVSPLSNQIPPFVLVNLVLWVSALAIHRFAPPRAWHFFLAAAGIGAVASGFSFAYGEYLSPTPILGRGAFYGAYVGLSLVPGCIALCLSFPGLNKSFQRSAPALITLAALSFAGFGNRGPGRTRDNLSLLFGGKPARFQDRLVRTPAFIDMASWARANTPPETRFLLLNNDGDVGSFKAFARRGTPLLQGGMYAYFGNLGHEYAVRNSEAFRRFLLSWDSEDLGKLGEEIGADLAIFEVATVPPPPSRVTVMYENEVFGIFDLGR